jgi:hypothetical protein
MAECTRITGCIFFNERMEDMPAAAGLLKEQFCHRDFHACARFRVEEKLGSTSVPASLLPQDSHAADLIVAGT